MIKKTYFRLAFVTLGILVFGSIAFLMLYGILRYGIPKHTVVLFETAMYSTLAYLLIRQAIAILRSPDGTVPLTMRKIHTFVGLCIFTLTFGWFTFNNWHDSATVAGIVVAWLGWRLHIQYSLPLTSSAREDERRTTNQSHFHRSGYESEVCEDLYC